METDYKRIFYLGIAWEEYPEKGQNLKKTGLYLKKLEREYPYFFGGGRRKIKKLQVYFALLPEYAGKKLLSGKMKTWKPENVQKLLNDAWERAYINCNCTEQIFTEQILSQSYKRDSEQIPVELMSTRFSSALPAELWAVCLYQARPFESLCILLPEDAGELEAGQLKELMEPYLPRMKRVVFKGPESMASESLADYLYEEFGIVMTQTQRIPLDMPVIDFGIQRCGGESLQSVFEGNIRDEGCNFQEGQKRHVYISRNEILKFLDIAVKNGYNTKVN